MYLTKSLLADGATLKLDNNKNEWKGVCVYQEHNGDEKVVPVSSLERWFVSIRKEVKNKNDILVSILDGRKKKRSQC